MSLFKKVGETEKMPEFMNNAFFEEGQSVNSDRFAELKNRAMAKKAQLSQLSQERETELDKLKKKYASQSNWDDALDRVQPTIYTEDRQTFSADSRAVTRFDGQGVRRISSDTDSIDSTRNIQYKAFTPEDYLDAMLRGASIFNPEMEELTIAFSVSQEEDQEKANMMNKRTLAIAKAEKRNAWEAEQLESVRKANVINTRAHPLLSAPGEYTSDNAFGLYDYEQIKKQEEMRVAQTDAEKERRLSIKRPGFDREGYNQEWQNPELHKAKTAKDIYKRFNLNLED